MLKASNNVRFLPSKILWVLTNRGKHAQTMLPHCQIQLEEKHIPSENRIHVPINLINKGRKTTYLKKKLMRISTWTGPLQPMFRLYNTKQCFT